LNETPTETLVLVMTKPKGNALDDAPSPQSAKALFAALRTLHDAGIAHRDLRPSNLIVSGDCAGFSSLDTAVPGAGELVRRLDVTQLLTTLGRSVGPVDAVAAFRSGYKSKDEEAIIAILQPIALAPWGWAAMREARGCVAEVRTQLVGSDEAAAPSTRLERFRWRTVASTVALTVIAFLFIGQFSRVNLLGALRHTNLGWFFVALLGSAITYFAAAANLAAFVPKRLSLVRGFFVQLSTAYVGVALPPTVGHVAVNSRYLTRENVDGSSIAAAVALSQIVNVVTTVPLLIVFGLLTGSGISRFKIVPGADLLIGLGAIAGIVGIVLLFPQTRARFTRQVWPHIRGVWPRLLSAVSQPLRLVAGIGSNLLLTFGYLVAFLAALHALGAHPALLPAAIVYLAGNTVGSFAPTPGGLGAIEAVLTAGLTAIGVPAHEAIPAVLIFRITTFWLPIPAGWLSYVVLQRHGTL
jgi:glycosyltransferase 2 family protein